ncbi:hypothetical protein E4U31_000557, partial [Claviceps sp. LM219 group G6]
NPVQHHSLKKIFLTRSHNNLSDEEDTPDFVESPPPVSLLKPSNLDTEKSLPEESVPVVCFHKENQAAHESEDVDAEENLPVCLLSERTSLRPANGSENSCNEFVTATS